MTTLIRLQREPFDVAAEAAKICLLYTSRCV